MPFQKYSIEKDELVNLFQKWRHLLILWKGNIYTYVLDTWHSLFQLCVGGYDLLLAGCDLFYLGVGGCGWVWPFLGRVWLGVGECDLFLAECGWVWVSVGGCGWEHGLQLPEKKTYISDENLTFNLNRILFFIFECS